MHPSTVQIDFDPSPCYNDANSGSFQKAQTERPFGAAVEKQMPNIRSAAKRARQDVRRRDRNRGYRSSARTAVKRARESIEESDPEALEAVRSAFVALDKAAQKGAIHGNNAARRKSRLTRQLNKSLAE